MNGRAWWLGCVWAVGCSAETDDAADAEGVIVVCQDCGGCTCVDGTRSRGGWCGPLEERPDWVCTATPANCATDCAAHGGVEGSGKCSPEAPALETCVRGAAFADCGGPDEPMVWCQSPEDGSWPECLWFSGCPAEGFDQPCPSPLSCETCEAAAAFVYSRGTEPWGRARAMNVAVEVGELDPPVEAVELSCEAGCEVSDGPARDVCGIGAGICGGEEANGPPIVFWSDPSPSSGLAWLGLTRPDLYGWTLELEIDPAASPPHARGCLTPYTDALGDCDGSGPVCATGGLLRLDRAVSKPAELPQSHGRFRLEFPEFATTRVGRSVRGLVVVGAF